MPSNKKSTSQIAIVGAGDVGATIAYSLIMNPSAGDILIIDPQEAVRDAQVQDLSDATFHGNTTMRIRAGTHKEAGQCDIIVMAAGAAQKKGESRTDLVGKNKKILKSAIDDMKPLREDAVLLVVANPVDVLTYFAQEYAGLPKAQVIGSGTFLDSARLKGILAAKTNVAASSIEASVLGEHGESQFVAWSGVSIGGVAINQYATTSLSSDSSTKSETSNIDKSAIAEETKNKATEIMNNKGATNFGIGAVAASLCKSILFDERNLRPVSHWQEDLGVCLSMPVVLGRGGVVGSVKMPLNEEEEGKLKKSAEALKEVINS